jgi:RNA polymerase sigma factor (TIGR02999 family)
MVAPDANDVTRLLRRMAQGDEAAPAELLPHLYEQLRGIAESLMAQQSPSHTLQPTALVHEAWLRMSGGDYEGREHFAAVAARAMRSVLVDHARRKRADKRGGAALRVPADLLLERIEEEGADVLALEDALQRLGERDPELLRIVELRFFGGLSTEETARVLGISTATLTRSWKVARLWLARELGPTK